MRHAGGAGKEVLEIVAASPVPAGAEVHNTYGEHGNAELVNKYGFALSRCGKQPLPDTFVDAAAAEQQQLSLCLLTLQDGKGGGCCYGNCCIRCRTDV